MCSAAPRGLGFCCAHFYNGFVTQLFVNGEWAMVNTAHSPLPIHQKNYKPHKPDSVSKLSFIWPRHYWRDLAAYPGSCLPLGRLGRAALKRSYTWHYSTQGLPVRVVTNHNRELLPHIFTFSSRFASGSSYFLWHYLFPVF